MSYTHFTLSERKYLQKLLSEDLYLFTLCGFIEFLCLYADTIAFHSRRRKDSLHICPSRLVCRDAFFLQNAFVPNQMSFYQ